jgi:ribonuclease-3
MAHPKGLLMERLKKLGVGKPEFRTANTGPEHQPTFLTDVLVDGEVYGTGQGSTKREAERLAAEEALAFLERNPLQGLPTEEGDGRGPPSDRFEGPWPVFERLLAASLAVANERTDSRLAGDEARQAVREFALELYKEMLEDLGDIVEVDEEVEA